MCTVRSVFDFVLSEFPAIPYVDFSLYCTFMFPVSSRRMYVDVIWIVWKQFAKNTVLFERRLRAPYIDTNV